MPNFKTPVGNVMVDKASIFELIDGNLYKVYPAHCQREYCWTPSQYQAFIQHAIDTESIGEVIVIIVADALYLVDGQHRIKALLDFKADVFPIKDIDTGEEFYYSQLCKIMRGFELDVERLCCSIRRIRMKEYNTELAQKIYDGYNFGGVKH